MSPPNAVSRTINPGTLSISLLFFFLSTILLVEDSAAQVLDCPDQDRDGYAACAADCLPAGLTCGDCDDADPGSYPGAAELCNHRDDDCDGAADEGFARVWTSQEIIDPDGTAGDRFGSAVAVIGDLDGDAVADLAFGAPTTDTPRGTGAGAVVLISGIDRSVLCRAVDPDGGAGHILGTSLAAIGDVTGDGIGDIAAGAPGAGETGRVAIISGADCSVARLCSDSLLADTYGAPTQVYRDLGHSVAGLGDVDGDSIPDFAAGDPSALDDGWLFIPNSGRAVIFSGASCAVLGHALPSHADENVNFASSLATLGDVDGDGIVDLAVGAPTEWNVTIGWIAVHSGATGVRLQEIREATAGDYLNRIGAAVGGISDINGDGAPDFLGGVPYANAGGATDAGAVLVGSGADGMPLRRCVDPVARAGDHLGYAVAALPDLNGDGVADFAAASPLRDTAAAGDKGSILLFSGADCALLSRLTPGGAVASHLGDRSLAIADLQGDASPEILAGWGRDRPEAATTPGRAVLFTGESDCNGDGLADEAADPFDRDGDGVGDSSDNCPDHPNPNQEDQDFDGVGDYCDNCVVTFNPSQVDFDGDGRGDLCDPCPGHPDTISDQTDSDGDGIPDACDPTVHGLIAALGGPGDRGSGSVAWETNAETDIAGFQVVTITPGGQRVQLSETMIPCQSCTVYGGGSYVFTLPKHRGGRRLYVEMHFFNGAVDLFGPAARELSVPGLMIDDPPPSVIPAEAAAPVVRGAVRRE